MAHPWIFFIPKAMYHADEYEVLSMHEPKVQQKNPLGISFLFCLCLSERFNYLTPDRLIYNGVVIFKQQKYELGLMLVEQFYKILLILTIKNIYAC